MTSHVDIMPSLLEFLHLPPLCSTHGLSWTQLEGRDEDRWFVIVDHWRQQVLPGAAIVGRCGYVQLNAMNATAWLNGDGVPELGCRYVYEYPPCEDDGLAFTTISDADWLAWANHTLLQPYHERWVEAM